MPKTIRLYFNKLSTRGKDNYGFLTHFHVYGLHWKLYFRGDAPLVIYHSENVLQVDGDVYNPIASELCAINSTDEEAFDSYLFSAEEAVDFFATMVYEDMELEYEDLEENDYSGPDFELEYEGENVGAFLHLQGKIARNEVLVIEDLERLNKKGGD